jgi:hypothetical protein
MLIEPPNGLRYRQGREVAGKVARRRIRRLGPESRKCGRTPALVRCTRCWAALGIE